MKVVLQNLTKVFPSRNKKSNEEVVAVSNFNFEIPDGKLIGLLGPSGCGKSTFLRLLSGIYAPDAGELFLDGVPANSIPPQKRDCAMIFQDYSLYPNMTVYENIGFYLGHLSY